MLALAIRTDVRLCAREVAMEATVPVPAGCERGPPPSVPVGSKTQSDCALHETTSPVKQAALRIRATQGPGLDASPIRRPVLGLWLRAGPARC